MELNSLLVCSQCGCSSHLMISVIISGLFTRQIPPALCYTVPQVSVTTPEKSFCKKCEYQDALEREAFILNVHFTVPSLASRLCFQRPAVCVVLGASSPLDGAGGYSWLQGRHQAKLQDSRLKIKWSRKLEQ